VVRDGALVVEEHPDPSPREGEVLIRVRAAGINGADLAQRAGRYPAPPGAPADIPGLECAGEVVGTGERVMALLGGGGQAELAVVDARHMLPVPEGIDWPPAGGFVETFATAHDALFTQAGLQPGERLLVTGASGGVGTAAVQLGIAIGAAVTGATRSNPDRVRELGASTEVEGEYDVILELVGGDNLRTDLQRLAPLGRLAVIGMGAGSKAEIDFGYLTGKRARIHGSHLRNRSADEKADVIARLRLEVIPLLAEGRVRVPVHATYPLEQAQEAYDAFALPGKFGKLVLVT
jgi:NADPH:quinone reductase-like Zn-dependent oxidoreductase